MNIGSEIRAIYSHVKNELELSGFTLSRSLKFKSAGLDFVYSFVRSLYRSRAIRTIFIVNIKKKINK